MKFFKSRILLLSISILLSIKLVYLLVDIFAMFIWVNITIMTFFIPFEIQALTIGLCFGIFFSNLVRKKFLRMIPKQFHIRQVTPSDFPAMNWSSLSEYTQILEKFGFVTVLEYSCVDVYDRPRSPILSHFGRLFFHPEHRCFGLINQFFSNEKKFPPGFLSMDYLFISHLDHEWSLSTSNYLCHPMIFAARLPTALNECFPGMTPDALLDRHLRLREDLIKSLGISVSADQSIEAFFSRACITAEQTRQSWMQKNSVALIWYLDRAEITNQAQWLGDYPKIAAERARQLG